MSLGPLEFLLILIPFLILAGIIAIVVKLVRNSNETRANTRRIANQLEEQKSPPVETLSHEATCAAAKAPPCAFRRPHKTRD